ncbi:hypothetical protein GCM10010168_51760 [Actinoplanes ianthinogenes]|uniref:DUF2510 domain-containing protein n=1 Tax=Actinoplanes ianthinogenes TaxID=122358 RepID=A0ABM7M3U1_9ACTN|nr:DUF2510 domain-containing protein [Actinoplanes ianthinogenes]BCJ46227.1 hypothetical protein Aiant_68840 [Actinoplanes ianthinogenes]GGR27189.1 hypothetical protein GCM10010168_51760 [Actinoplanes ianthinogenes]
MTIPAQPAGWYADPSGLPATRWWDGQQWTDHLQPGPAVLPPTAGLGGYFPAAAPSGPLVPGEHTVAPADPERAEIFATQSSGAAGAAFPAARATGTLTGGALPAPPAELLDYGMPPVDGPAADLFAPVGPVLSPAPDRRPAAQHATGLLTHPLLLGALIVVVLAGLVAFALLR